MEHRPDTVDPASLAPPCRALFEGLRAEVAALTERNRRLEHLLRELRRAMFAKKSEKLHADAACEASRRGTQHRSSAGPSATHL